MRIVAEAVYEGDVGILLIPNDPDDQWYYLHVVPNLIGAWYDTRLDPIDPLPEEAYQ